MIMCALIKHSWQIKSNIGRRHWYWRISVLWFRNDIYCYKNRCKTNHAPFNYSLFFFILWYTNLSIKRWNIKQYKINYKGNLEYVKSVVFSFGSNISSGALRCRLQNVSKETSCDFVILLNQYLKHEVYINII